ncbi:MAG: hypothetical protein M3O55_00380 [Actinomycetota bacterium]|nr:hypothetical protein [Actinomycetota bacterium]
MTAPTTTPEIDRYVAAVRVALADLSAEDRDDLMEDVESHLAEVAAENTGSLEARLGKPADYAAELRSSAGLPMTGPQVRQSWRTGLSAAVADSPVGRRLAAITGNRQYAALRRFMVELRPGWWVMRGYLVVLLLSGGQRSGIFPRIAGNALLGLVLTIAAVWASVRLGRHWQSHPPTNRFWVVLVTALTGIVVLLMIVSGWSGVSRPEYYSGPGPVGKAEGIANLSNIYAFDSEGNALTGVQLFDQDGNPIDVTGPMFDRNGMEVPLRPLFNAAGAPVNNVFPRQSANGVVPVAPFVAPRLAPSAPSSPAPSAGPSAAASPSPSAVPSPR